MVGVAGPVVVLDGDGEHAGGRGRRDEAAVARDDLHALARPRALDPQRPAGARLDRARGRVLHRPLGLVRVRDPVQQAVGADLLVGQQELGGGLHERERLRQER